MLMRMSFALVGAAMAVQACATSPASSYRHIADPEQIFAAADWTADVEAAVNAAGWADRKPQIMAAMSEQGAWPAKMKSGDARWFNMDSIRAYNVSVIAPLSFYGQSAYLLHVPATANAHMAEGWKPTADFFVLVGVKAFP